VSQQHENQSNTNPSQSPHNACDPEYKKDRARGSFGTSLMSQNSANRYGWPVAGSARRLPIANKRTARNAKEISSQAKQTLLMSGGGGP